MRILLTGQCTLHWGRMEYGNLGNYAIIEPFIRELHRVFPNVEIRTTFQMTDEFCKRERIKRLPMKLYYEWRYTDLWKSLWEVLSAGIKKYFKIAPLKTAYIKECLAADLIIDFSGDMWGDNADLVGKHRFLIGLCKDLTAHLLRKPVVLLAGSPGPFKKWWHRFLAKMMLKRFNLITNREPISTEWLLKNNFSIQNIKTLACPAFLFEARSDDEMSDIYAKECLLDPERPTVGFIICGWNMPVGPFDRWPRNDNDFQIFAEAVEYIENQLGARVCLLSHNNGFIPPPNFKMMPGRDHQMLLGLMNILNKRGKAKNLLTLDGLYDAAQTKAIIRQFDMLVSGRIHAAVAGLTQKVPTVLIDYGHEPRAHKLRGFAAILGIEKYLADPANKEDLIGKIGACWNNREFLRQYLKNRIPEVKELSRENFNLLRQVVKEK